MVQSLGNIKCIRMKNELAGRIESGQFPFGSRFPGVHELCKEFKISYVTVCKAVKLLENEGYLRCQPGIGYFVCYSSLAEAAVKKEVNIISSRGYYKKYQEAFDAGVAMFEQRGWQVNLLFGSRDLYELKPAINSPETFSVITAFNVNWERFAATFGHITRRVVVLGRLSGNPEITSIVSDECASVKLCMEYFAALGRKKVALVSLLPFSELEALRIAAWRNVIDSYGLSFDWMRRHLFSLAPDGRECTRKEQYELLKNFLKENLHDTEAVILPSPLQSFMEVAEDLGIKLPDDLAVVAIGCRPDFILEYPAVCCLDNNFAGHFKYAVDILEDRFIHGENIPGAWNFCPPGKIISVNDLTTQK